MFNRQMSTAVSAGLPAKPAERPKMPLATSVSLSTAFAIGGCFSATYWIAQTLVHVWKGARLPYPGVSYARWGLELAYLIAYAFVEPIRVFLGEKANRGLHAPTLYASAALALPVAGMHCYLCFGQTYVLKVDEFLNACALAFVGTQTVLSAFAVGAFPRGRPGGWAGRRGARGAEGRGGRGGQGGGGRGRRGGGGGLRGERRKMSDLYDTSRDECDEGGGSVVEKKKHSSEPPSFAPSLAPPSHPPPLPLRIPSYHPSYDIIVTRGSCTPAGWLGRARGTRAR